MEHLEEQQYTKGFNNGYLLAKHEPELASRLMTQPNEHNAYFRGLLGGKQEYEQEVLEWAKSFSRNSPSKEDRTPGKER